MSPKNAMPSGQQVPHQAERVRMDTLRGQEKPNPTCFIGTAATSGRPINVAGPREKGVAMNPPTLPNVLTDASSALRRSA